MAKYVIAIVIEAAGQGEAELAAKALVELGTIDGELEFASRPVVRPVLSPSDERMQWSVSVSSGQGILTLSYDTKDAKGLAVISNIERSTTEAMYVWLSPEKTAELVRGIQQWPLDLMEAMALADVERRVAASEAASVAAVLSAVPEAIADMRRSGRMRERARAYARRVIPAAVPAASVAHVLVADAFFDGHAAGVTEERVRARVARGDA